MSTYDVIVLGCGGAGSAAMYHLAQRGVSVLGIDQFPGGHDRGSSHGQTRIIRKAYFEHADYVPLLQRAYELWAELEARRGEKLYHQTGLIEVGPADGVVVPGVLTSARQHGLDVEELTNTDVVGRFAGFVVPDDCQAVFEREAGYLLVEPCVLAHLEEAEQFGAVHQTGESIIGWRAQGNGIEVNTDKGTYSAAALVMSAGAWASQVLADVPVTFRVVRKHLHWFANEDANYRRDAGCPTFFYETPQGYYYGFPQIDELGVKVAEHSGGEIVNDPLKVNREVDAAERARVIRFLTKNLPGVSSRPTHHTVCMYTLTPDEHFILDSHPQHSNIAICAGLSGHGFKFTPVLGEVLADLVLDHSTKHPIEFLRLKRTTVQSEET